MDKRICIVYGILFLTLLVVGVLYTLADNNYQVEIKSLQIELKMAKNAAAMFENNWAACEAVLNAE